MQLSDKYPFLTKYFNEAKNTNNYSVFQSILLYGSDLETQYKLALYIAKMLNCEKDFDEFCNCQNCRWIDAHEHPAVVTVSKEDYKPSDDKTKNVISVKQAQMIKNSLTNSSDYHRVFIFCDKGKNGEILGINKFNFQEKTANSLLKTIEEPPKNTTFIFLTRDKNDVLLTIQSRCMAFFVPSFEKESYDYSLIEDVFADYFEFERGEVFNIANDLFQLTKEHEPLEVLESLQHYMLCLMKNNTEDKNITNRLINDLKQVETAKKEVKLGMNVQNVLEDMCLKIIK